MGALAEGPHEARVERFVLVAGDGTPVDAIHARPVTQPDACLVVHPDMLGVRDLFDDLCRRLATHGFAVACAEPFARFPPEVRDTQDASVRMAHMKDMDDDLQLGDLAAAAAFLTTGAAVERVSILGFCMGGMYTLKAVKTARFRRHVPFYGMIHVPENWRGAGQGDPLAAVRQGDAQRVLAVVGTIDAFTPPAVVDELEGAGVTVVRYHGADHAFVHDPERPVHKPLYAKDAWARAIDWLTDSWTTAA
jgi:dienelactone hydrolase